MPDSMSHNRSRPTMSTPRLAGPAPGRRAALFLLLSLGTALLAQYLFTGELLTHYRDSQTWEWRREFTAGTVLLLVAILFATAAESTPEPADEEVDGPVRPVWRELFGLAPAALLYAASLIGYLTARETALVDLTWAASILALLLPLVVRSRRRGSLRRWRVAIDRSTWPEWGAVAVLTGLAFFLRFWQLDDIPSHVDEDVALMGVHALDLIDRHDFRWIGASSSQHLLAYDQLLAWSMRLFGEDRIGLVMHDVLTGTLAIPLTYLLGRRMFGPRVALVGAALLCVDYTHIQFSRILFGASPTFVLALVVLLLHVALRSRDPLWFALAGVISGLNFALYDSARVIPVVCAAAFLWALPGRPARGPRATPAIGSC